MTSAVHKLGFNPQQLLTIKRTVASDTNDLEFDLFLEACRSYGLDPFRKQIHAVVYSKDNPKKRKMTIIVSRDGARVIAQRCGDYRPASAPTVFEYDNDLKGPTNPKGIVTATVTLHKQDKSGDWYPVVGQADWDEFAPVKENWSRDGASGRDKPDGTFKLDASGQWAKMPKVMITKCAEAQALRAGWPEQFGNIYQEEEMDRFGEDVTATMAIENHQTQERQKLIGGRGIMFVFDDTAVMERVSVGQVADRCLEFSESATPQEAFEFITRNRESINEFWAHDKPAALTVKKQLEAKANLFDPAKEVA